MTERIPLQNNCRRTKEIILQERAKKNGQELKYGGQNKNGRWWDEHANPNINGVVAGAGLDTYIPTIPDVKDADIIAKLKYKRLTKI